MKTFLTLMALSSLALAHNGFEGYIDDLQNVPWNFDKAVADRVEINYPNYRIGGGIPPRGEIRDRLVLDVRHSDAAVSIEQKLALGRRLEVRDGFHSAEEATELTAAVKDSKVVFYLNPGAFYVTGIHAKTRDGKSLGTAISETIPGSQDPNSPVPVSLLYVRNCRL